MMHDGYGAIEGGADSVGGADIGGHILAVVFTTAKRSIQGVEYHQGGAVYVEMPLNRGNQLALVGYQV
jgi:hypothetical protein